MVQKHDIPIKEIGDILEKPKYKLLVLGGSVLSSFLKHSYEDKHRNVWEKVVEEKGIISDDMEGEKQILNDPHKILLSLSPEIEMQFKSFPCQFVASKVFYNEHTAGYVFNKDSQYRDLFSYHITRIKESGLDTEWYNPQKKLDTDGYCEDGRKHGEKFITLSYNDVIFAFVIFASGCLIALFYFVVERIYIKYFAKNESVKKLIDLEEELSQLRVFIKRNNDGLTQIDQHLKNRFKENSDNDHSRIKLLLLDLRSMYNKMFDLLEHEMSLRE